MTNALELEVECPPIAWAGFLAVALGILVLAHGCHGPDEDHELFAPKMWDKLPACPFYQTKTP